MANFFDQFDEAPAAAPAAPAAASSAPLKITVTPGGGNFFDQFDGPRADAAPEAPKASGPQSIATDFMNQGSAAGQRTSPIISAHEKNLVSADVHQDELGNLHFRDQSGALLPTDRNKHVVLRDPTDNTLKVFARTADTDEGRISAAGRLLGTGMASGAPTARPGIALAAKAEAPSSDWLKLAATADYEGPAVTGLSVRPSALTQRVETLTSELNKSGFDENVAPKTFGILRKATSAPEDSVVTGQNLHSLRRTLGKAAQSPDGTERAAASRAIRDLDEFLGRLPEAETLSGNAQEASQAFERANANYSAAKHADTIDAKRVRAELRAAAANSGQNVTNATRQRIADILLNDNAKRGFTADELGLMEKIVRGTPTQNVLRGAGNMLGGGGGLGAVVSAGAGAAATGGPGVIAPAIGFTLKKIGNALTQRQVDQLSEMIRSRSPLAEAMNNSSTAFQAKYEALAARPSYEQFAQLSLAARNLANNMRSAGIEVSPRELLRAVQGSINGSAGEDQRD